MKRLNRKLDLGFWCRCAFLVLALVFTASMSCQESYAWFATTRESGTNKLTMGSYDVAVTPQNGESTGDETYEYTVKLEPQDIHVFSLSASGTVSQGHVTVTVLKDEKVVESFNIELDPLDAEDTTNTTTLLLKAATGSTVRFSPVWGASTSAIQKKNTSKNAPGKKGARSMVSGGQQTTYEVEVSTTPHITYTVASGASLKGIARYYAQFDDELKNDVTAMEKAIRVYNGLADDAEVCAGQELEIPYVEGNIDPYVPKGRLDLSVSFGGDTSLPTGASICLYDAAGNLAAVGTANGNSLTVKEPELAVGTYTVELNGVQQGKYDLDMKGFPGSIEIKENESTELTASGTYTRQTGKLYLKVDMSGAQNSNLTAVVTGEEATVTLTYRELVEGCTITLPTDSYTVTLNDVGLEGYDEYLETGGASVTVKDSNTTNQCAEWTATVTYTRQTGELELYVDIQGVTDGSYPSGLNATVTDSSGEVVYSGNLVNGYCIIENLPTGTYDVELSGTNLDGYTLLDESELSKKCEVGQGEQTVRLTLRYEPIAAAAPIEENQGGEVQ